ncbi:MAG: TVP38/TMEM64 family protein [Alphaproteobacteria bacterium]
MTLAKTLIVIFLIADIAAALFFLPFRDWFVQFEQYVKSLGSLGPIVVAFAYVVTTILFIPGSALTIGSGTLFGFKTGFLVVLIGANLGALCAFLLARTLLREKVAKWAQGNVKFRSLDRAIGNQGFKMVFLTRLSPVFPFNLLNYLLGLTAISTSAYILANLLGMLPGIFLYVYIGAAARDAIVGVNSSAGTYQQVLKYVGLLATLAVVIIVTRIARKALREAEQDQESFK